ncbi:hypothetical protein TNCV_1448051 [Trichonephila clavipes]|nr:hypothetical protein TNCV_1448051 [Trichonephila clavipes]
MDEDHTTRKVFNAQLIAFTEKRQIVTSRLENNNHIWCRFLCRFDAHTCNFRSSATLFDLPRNLATRPEDERERGALNLHGSGNQRNLPHKIVDSNNPINFNNFNLRVLVAALWDKKLAFRTRVEEENFGFWTDGPQRRRKEIFGSRAASKFSFEKESVPAHKRSN